MFRNVALTFVISLALPVVLAWDLIATQGAPVTILPQDCRVLVNEELSMSLDGFLPSNAVVTWDVDQGSMASVLPGLESIFVAPSQPAVVTISATVSVGMPGMETHIMRQCTVTSPKNAPRELSLH